ncbi:MAG: hypothetical protein ACI4GX_01955 [Ruminococcus sp.]
MSLFLGIDTSNYTTSTAIFNSKTGEMLQQKKLLPVKHGRLGLRQSDAVFHHTVQLHSLFSELVKDIDVNQIAAIGVSTKPRPIDGSYMPCFTVGENTAKILSSALRIPLFSFSHQEGHISAALYSAKRDDLFSENFIAFHVSGGTTEAVLANGKGDSFSAELVASSLDLHAGQAVDRVGVMLGLDFPCGAELEKLLGIKPGRIFDYKVTRPDSVRFAEYRKNKEEQKEERAKRKVLFYNAISRRCRPESDRLKGITFNFSRLIEDKVDVSIPLVEKIRKSGGKYTDKVSECTIYVCEEDDDSIRTKNAKEMPNLKIMNLTLLGELLND